MPRQTTFIKPGSNRLTWRHVDASGKVLGRLATQVATVLMGKHRPDYTPNVDCGEAVVVTNASAVALTGRKAEQKTLRKWSGYPGGLRVRTYKTLLQEDKRRAKAGNDQDEGNADDNFHDGLRETLHQAPAKPTLVHDKRVKTLF